MIADCLIDLLFPPTCYGCGDYADRGSPLCWRCVERMEPLGAIGADDLPPPYEPGDACGQEDALRHADAWTYMDALIHAGEVMDDDYASVTADRTVDPISVFCGWRFVQHGPLSRVIHALKYDNRPWLGTALGGALAEAIRRQGFPLADVVVPIPLHRLKQLERGYNQSEWIGRAVAERLRIDVTTSLLRRTTPTQTQTQLSRTDRWSNVKDAFETTEQLDGASVLIIDDVVTTGATAYAAALTLREAGCAAVRAAAVAFSSS